MTRFRALGIGSLWMASVLAPSRPQACAAEMAALRMVTARRFFASPAGSDQNPGISPEAALRWIQTAIDRSQAGDAILLLPGKHGVRPGDKNIAFSGKKGTPEAPILMTTAGAGVVIDLTDAAPGWGGIRISDGSAWLVLDGGGTPNPFDEKTYWLTIENAAYDRAQGADRTSINCRPCTIQGSNNIVVRNIFGRHSMGGMASWSDNVLIDTCRFQPGKKPRDPGASHGIYAGGTTTIRNTFIKWAGDGRLGVQNNGGGPGVVIEKSYITECPAAIKSFNGGLVTVKDCYFWGNFEAPCQGEVKVLSMITTTPPAEVIAAAGARKRPGPVRSNKEEWKMAHEALAREDLPSAYLHFANVTAGRADDDLVLQALESLKKIEERALDRLKAAQALEAIGEAGDAIAAYQELIREFAGIPAATVAKERVESLRKAPGGGRK